MADPQLTISSRLSHAIDIHSHILPDIDDGSGSLEESFLMALTSARYGTSRMIATPHRYYGNGENTPDALRELAAKVQDHLESSRLNGKFQVLVGQEIPLTPMTAEELQAGNVLTLADTGMYALVEPPFDHLPNWMAEALALIVEAGIKPVLAHPERNDIIKRNPELVRPFIEAGALLQLTAMSITGENSSKAFEASMWMLEHDLVTVVASDTHSPTWRSPNLRSAFHVVRERFGLMKARRLFIENPAVIADGKPLPLPVSEKT